MKHWILGVGMVMTAAGAAADPFTKLDIDAAAGSDVTADLVCKQEGAAHAPFTAARPGTRSDLTLRDGRVQVVKAPSTLSFPAAKAGAYARVAVKTTAGSRIALCGPIVATEVYDISSVTRGAAELTVSLFDADAPKQLAAYRRAKLDEIGRAEREALRASPAIQGFAILARNAVVMPTNDSIHAVSRAADAAMDELERVRALWRCNGHEPAGLLKSAICEETFVLTNTVQPIRGAFVEARARSNDVSVRRWQIGLDHLGERVQSIALLPAVSPDARADQCKAIARLRWLNTKDMLRLHSRATIPMADHVVVVPYGGNTAVEDAAAGVHGLVASGVPTGEKTAFRLRKGKRTTLEIAVLVNKFISVALGALPVPAGRAHADVPALKAQLMEDEKQLSDAKALLSVAKGELDGLTKNLNELRRSGAKSNQLLEKQMQVDVQVKAVGQLEAQTAAQQAAVDQLRTDLAFLDSKPRARVAIPSLLCEQEGDMASAIEVLVDADLPPASGIENLGYRFQVEKHHEATVVLCTGESCSAAEDEKTDKAKLSVTPSRHGTFTLLAELAAVVGTEGGYDTLGASTFRPVRGAEGPDQVFELQRVSDPRNAVSTSLLLALRFKEEFSLSVGPSMLIGTTPTVLQWNARLGVRLGGGVYLTTGPSMRAIEYPDDYAIGDRVSVPRGMDGGAAAPKPRTHFERVWMWQAGLAFDLAELGDVAADIYKTLGGGK